MPKRIMVINDTMEILELFRDILVSEGYEVTLHAYGAQEVDDVRRVKPDLIISDYPPLDRELQGWQFVQKVKMSRDTASIPIVVCTTNLRAIGDNQSWMTTKGIIVVPKPFEVDELLRAVEQQIGKADEQDQGPFDQINPDLMSTPGGDGSSES